MKRLTIALMLTLLHLPLMSVKSLSLTAAEGVPKVIALSDNHECVLQHNGNAIIVRYGHNINGDIAAAWVYYSRIKPGYSFSWDWSSQNVWIKLWYLASNNILADSEYCT